jgi:hypothetical protein
MEKIKDYFRAWDFSRYVRMGMGVGLGIGYAATGESIYLLGAIIFSVQALFNMGCPGELRTPAKPAQKKQVMNLKNTT